MRLLLLDFARRWWWVLPLIAALFLLASSALSPSEQAAGHGLAGMVLAGSLMLAAVGAVGEQALVNPAGRVLHALPLSSAGRGRAAWAKSVVCIPACFAGLLMALASVLAHQDAEPILEPAEIAWIILMSAAVIAALLTLAAVPVSHTPATGFRLVLSLTLSALGILALPGLAAAVPWAAGRLQHAEAPAQAAAVAGVAVVAALSYRYASGLDRVLSAIGASRPGTKPVFPASAAAGPIVWPTKRAGFLWPWRQAVVQCAILGPILGGILLLFREGLSRGLG